MDTITDAENMQEKGTVHISTRSDQAQVNEVIKTRSGHVIKDTRQTHMHINTIKAQPACQPPLKRLYGLTALFLNSKHVFLYDILPAGQQADITQ